MAGASTGCVSSGQVAAVGIAEEGIKGTPARLEAVPVGQLAVLFQPACAFKGCPAEATPVRREKRSHTRPCRRVHTQHTHQNTCTTFQTCALTHDTRASVPQSAPSHAMNT